MHNAAGMARKGLLALTATALAALFLWFCLLPEQDYEPVPNQIDRVSVSEDITETGITQSLVSKGRLRGIRVIWATSKTIPADDVFADLKDPESGAVLERVTVPASRITDNQETDIVFAGTYDPGKYLVRLSGLPDSTSKIAVWESTNDCYREGEARNSAGEDEGRDWSFNVLTGFTENLLIRHRAGRIVGAALTVMFTIAALCWLVGEERLRRRRWIAAANGFVRKNADGILIALLFLLPTVMYMDFLMGDRLYIFTMLDRGADSVGQTYPGLLNTAVRLQKGLWGELFNFRQGLGETEAAYFPTLTNWVALFGESMVARLLAVSQWVKVVLSGIFAYLFVREYGAGIPARFLIALGYAFNSMLIARGAWESYPNISLLAILWLYAFERKLNGKGILLSFFATLFMFINLGLYDCIFYGALLPCYMLIRRIIREGTVSGAIKAFLGDLTLFAVFALVGMLDTVRHMLARTLSSTRLQEGIDGYEEAVRGGFFSAPEIWMSAFLRTVGHSISGIHWQTGSLNLLEGPAFYTGIVTALTVPAALWCMKGKQKGLFLILTLGAACYIAIVPLRLIANGFAKETFKLSSFWIAILLLLFSADFFRRAERQQLRRGTKAVQAVSALVFIGLLILGKADGYVSSDTAWWISLAFVILYLVLTEFLIAGKHLPFVKYMLILCAVTEALLVPYDMINSRCMESPGENSMKERSQTKEVLSSLPQDDWYRIEKDYVNVFQSDSLAEGYRGSASYLGGIEISRSVLDIYRTFSLPQRGNHYLFGSGGNIYFESASSTKYLLSRNDMEFRYGYMPVKEQNGIRVYENLYCHPFVYLSTDPVSYEDFRGKPDQYIQVGFAERNNTIVFGKLPEDTVLIMEAELDVETRCTIYMEDRKGHFSSAYFMGGPHALFEIANPEVLSVWFDTSTRRHMKDVAFYVADRESYYRAYREQAFLAQQHKVSIQQINENHFQGIVTSEQNGYMITAIPYDPKWKICLGEKILDTIVVNGGFLGAKIPEGQYLLDIQYNGKSWLEGNIFKIIGIGAFILAAIVLLSYKQARKRGNH